MSLPSEAKLHDAAADCNAFGLFEDFIRQDSVADGGAFDATVLNTGTAALLAANGGWITLSGAATTDNSGAQIQSLAGFVCTANKVMNFKCRADLNEATSTNGATESNFLIGMANIDTTMLDGSGLTAQTTDGFYFLKDDGGTTMKCVSLAASSATTTTLTASQFTTDDSAHRYGISVTPGDSTTGEVVFYIDGVEVARHRAQTMPLSSIILAPTVAYVTGDNTGTKGIAIDWIGAWQKR